MSKKETHRRFLRGSRLLSYSQLSEWFTCGYRWRLGWVRHISGWGVSKALETGAAIHVGLEAAVHAHVQLGRKAKPQLLIDAANKAIRAWYKEWLKDRRKLLAPEDVAAIDEALAAAFVVTERAVHALRFDRWKTVIYKKKPMVEAEIVIPLPSDRWDGFSAHLDWVAEDLEQGGVWIVDYKSRKQLQPPEAEEVNLQHAIYQHLLRIGTGIKSVGSLTFQMLSRGPTQPKRNRDGSMSRARIATDWTTYSAALRAANLNPSDYADMREKLDVVFFREDRSYRGTQEVETIWDEIVLPAMRHLNAALDDGTLAVRHLSNRNCHGCWARVLCLAELRGDDIDFLLKTSFIDLDKPQQRMILTPDDVDFDENG